MSHWGSSLPGANRHDSPLLQPTPEQARQQVADLTTGSLPAGAQVHLDSCYDSGKTRELLNAELRELGTQLHFDRNETLIAVGAPCDHVLLIEHGLRDVS